MDRRWISVFASFAALAALFSFALLTGAPATADSSPSPAASASPPPVEPSEDELAEQRQNARELAEAAKQKVATSDTARARLDELALEAGKQLEAFHKASTAAREARAQQALEQARYEAAEEVVREQRLALGRYASSTYRNASGSGQMAVIASLLNARSVTDIGRTAADLEWAGVQQSHAVDRLEAAELVAARAMTAAERAAARAEAAEQRAREAQEKADLLVAEQDALVVQLDRAAAKALDAAASAKTKAAQMEKARIIAAQYRAEAERQRRAALRRGEVVQVLVDGSCRGGDISEYPNGQIPRDLLCPVWGAEWHILRADAAATFNKLSKAYAEEFGRPICITDSYRSLELQIDVHKRKPDMTAVPGTSNHGWGTAVDLCDGIERFGTPGFRWMQVNAPRFHWYHPSWAAQGRGREEPWHWEFAA